MSARPNDSIGKAAALGTSHARRAIRIYCQNYAALAHRRVVGGAQHARSRLHRNDGELLIVRFDTSAILALTRNSSSLELIEEALRSHHDRILAAAAAALEAGFTSVGAEGIVVTLSALDL